MVSLAKALAHPSTNREVLGSCGGIQINLRDRNITTLLAVSRKDIIRKHD